MRKGFACVSPQYAPPIVADAYVDGTLPWRVARPAT
jgi:hypothetical protein